MDVGIRYTVNPPPTEAFAKPISVNVCRDGEWSTPSLISQSAAHQGSFGSGPLHFTLTVHGRDYSVSVNGRELIRTTQVDSGYVDSVRFTNTSSGATPNAITLSNFVLTPTAS